MPASKQCDQIGVEEGISAIGFCWFLFVAVNGQFASVSVIEQTSHCSITGSARKFPVSHHYFSSLCHCLAELFEVCIEIGVIIQAWHFFF